MKWLVLTFLVMMGLAAAGLSLFVTRARVVDDALWPSLDELGPRSGVVFPESANLLTYHEKRGMDEYMQAKVSLPVEDLQAFIERSPITLDRLDAAQNYRLGIDHDTWDPESTPGLRTGEAWLDALQRALIIGITEPVGKQVTLYLVAHAT